MGRTTYATDDRAHQQIHKIINNPKLIFIFYCLQKDLMEKKKKKRQLSTCLKTTPRTFPNTNLFHATVKSETSLPYSIKKTDAYVMQHQTPHSTCAHSSSVLLSYLCN